MPNLGRLCYRGGKLTLGYRLPAKCITHTVGSVWRGGIEDEAVLLPACYENSLKLAVVHPLQSLAFPCISTGIYGYPLREPAEIAVDTVAGFLNKQPQAPAVTFCCFSDATLDFYQSLLARR